MSRYFYLKCRAALAHPKFALFSYVIFLTPFLIGMAMHLWHAPHLLLAHSDVTYPEGACIASFLRTFHTGRLYYDPFQFPWNEQMYGPLFYMLGSATALLTHGDPQATTVALRCLSFLCFLGSAFVIAALAWRLEASRLAWLTLPIALAYLYSQRTAEVARPDFLSIFFMLAAILAYEFGSRSLRYVVLAGVLLSVAFLFKQNCAVVLAVFLIDCAFDKNLKKAAVTCSGFLLIPASVAAALYLHHEQVLPSITAARFVSMSWAKALPVLLSYVRANQISLLVLFLAGIGAWQRFRHTRFRAVLLATLILWVSSIASLANIGGAANYTIAPYLISLVFIPAGYNWIQNHGLPKYAGPALFGAVGIILLFHQRNLLSSRERTDLDASPVSQLTLLSDIPYLELRSRDPQMLDPYYYHQLVLGKHWSAQPVDDNIRHKTYDLVLLTGAYSEKTKDFSILSYRGISLWGEDQIDRLRENYRMLCEVGDQPGASHYFALVPQGNQPATQPADIAQIFGSPCLPTNRFPQLSPGSI